MRIRLSAIWGLSLAMACSAALAQQASGVKRVPLSQILAGSTAPAAPKDPNEPTITIPARYVSRKLRSGDVVVGLPADVESFGVPGASSSVTEGLFVFTITMDRSYHPSKRRLSDEAPDFASMMERSGFKNVRVQRKDVGRMSALNITFKQRGGPGYEAFIALGDSGPVVRVGYVVPEMGSQADARRWNDFFESLAPANVR